MTPNQQHKIHTCDRCGDTATKPETINGRTLCESCYTRDEDTGQAHALRDNTIHVYLDERLHDPDEGIDGHAVVNDGWNLADAGADFDHIDFRNAYWGAINNAAHDEAHRHHTDPNLTGSWRITYDRTGTVHSAERLAPAGHYV